MYSEKEDSVPAAQPRADTVGGAQVSGSAEVPAPVQRAEGAEDAGEHAAGGSGARCGAAEGGTRCGAQATL